MVLLSPPSGVRGPLKSDHTDGFLRQGFLLHDSPDGFRLDFNERVGTSELGISVIP